MGKGRGRLKMLDSTPHNTFALKGKDEEINFSIKRLHLSQARHSSKKSLENPIDIHLGSSLDSSSKKQLEPPSFGTIDEKQTKCGTSGRQILLKANHFPMEINIPFSSALFPSFKMYGTLVLRF